LQNADIISFYGHISYLSAAPTRLNHCRAVSVPSITNERP